jgi:membrane protein YqaA with SNARE-associated domain
MTLDPALGLGGLFASAFVSATLLPGSSEAVLAAVVAADRSLGWTAVAVATIGNTLGGLTSYAIGRLIPGQARDSRALAFARRYGTPVLLLSWVPLIGDALCVASGWLRHRLLPATIAIAAGKLVRYVAVLYGVRWLTG